MKLSKRASLFKFALAYQGNLGFEEIFKFYQIASPELSQQMDFLLENNLIDRGCKTNGRNPQYET
jgi:hypothetical protein